MTREPIVARLALVVSTLHVCSTTSATTMTSTASSSPSPSSSTLLSLSRGPTFREFEAIAPHMSALVAIVALAVESAAPTSIALVVATVSARSATTIVAAAAKSASSSSSAPSTAISPADACFPSAIRPHQLTAAEILLKDSSLHVFK
ncbi:unnamed protein product [Closterium sp. NIES-54]